MQHMPRVILQSKAAMSQAKHSVGVRAHAGKQGGPAWGAGWRGVASVAEKDSRGGELLQVGRGDSVAIGLDVAACVVRMDVENVGRTLALGQCGSCGGGAACNEFAADHTGKYITMKRFALLAFQKWLSRKALVMLVMPPH